MGELAVIFISAALVNNFVLARFLGICPFLGVSKKTDTAFGMGMAVIFVMTLAAVGTFLVYHYVLVPLNLTFLQIVSFILIIASLVQLVETFLRKMSPALYQALGIFLPLITTNCAVFGVCVLNIDKELDFLPALVTSFGYASGFGFALILFAGLRERILLARVPKPLQDTSIALITAGMISLSFYAFRGMV